jgi:soluble lytic murein transglycosylase-like protein
MLKDMIKEYVKVKYQRLSLVQYLLLILVVISGLALIYAATVPGTVADAGYYSSLIKRSGDEKAAMKQAVLKWMGENSAMPDHILTKIYNSAARTGNRDLILAICLVESNFNPQVESGKVRSALWV